MGFRDTVRTGLSLVRRSVDVLREHPKLLIFPALSAASLLLFFVGGVLALALIAVSTGVGEGITEGYWELASLAVGYFVAAVLSTYFNAGLVHETTQVLRGEPPSLGRGLAAGWRVKEKIVVWGIISSAVGIAIELLESSDSRVAWLVAGLLQASWAVLTFFVVPVILFTDTGLRGMFEESARTFRGVWGESLTASLGIDLLSALACALIVVAVVVLAALPATGGGVVFAGVFVVGVLSLFVVLVVRAAAHGVAKAALYEYATTGSLPAVLDEIDVAALGESGA